MTEWLADIKNIIALIIAIVTGLSSMYQYFDKQEQKQLSNQQLANIAQLYSQLCK